MTEFDIQRSLFNHFKTLNEFSGINYLQKDKNGKYTNVSFPNEYFVMPADKRFFVLTFRNNEPTDSAILDDSQNRYTGVFYIDVYSPLNVAETEVETKYKWIAKLFRKYTYIDDVVIRKCYVATKQSADDYYRLLIAIEWEADIDKE